MKYLLIICVCISLKSTIHVSEYKAEAPIIIVVDSVLAKRTVKKHQINFTNYTEPLKNQSLPVLIN